MDTAPHYGIDTKEAGTSQEMYFMVVAGLLHKNLLVQMEIRDLLKKGSVSPTAAREIPDPELDFHISRQGKKARDEKK